VQTYTSQYSDVTFNSRSNYPIIVVQTPTFSHEYFSLGSSVAEGTIDISIYTTNAQAADRFLDAINNSIETYKDDLREVGLRFVDLVGIDTDMFERGHMKIHRRTVTWRFNYIFAKTIAY